jgi:ribosomal protein S18 acetylase RimI-like enzyme
VWTDISIAPLDQERIPDRDVEDLLKRVYVGGRFTDADAAEAIFRACDIRARGEVIVAHDARGTLCGMVITVFPGSPACRFAKEGESELHLLAVREDRQGQGIGARLVDAAIAAARAGGARRMLLWTQPVMERAQHLYEHRGFERVPSLDFSRGGRAFRVFALEI